MKSIYKTTKMAVTVFPVSALPYNSDKVKLQNALDPIGKLISATSKSR